MTPQNRFFLIGALVVMGAGWGATMPLTKMAVSTGHGHFGLIFWQLFIGTVMMGAIALIRGRGLSLGKAQLKTYLAIALIGTILPNTASYQAIAHLPAGVMSILLSLIPMMAFPIALVLGLDKLSLGRVLGLLVGLAGVALLVLPEASLPDRAVISWVSIALLACLCYAFEGNYVAKWGTAGLDGLEVLFGASLLGTVMLLPVVIGSGQWINPLIPFGIAEWALVAASIIHVIVYAGYVWLVGRAGPVFAVQVTYLVTGFGFSWSILLLDESFSPYIWAAMGLMFVGLFLVQPRANAALAPDAAMGDTGG